MKMDQIGRWAFILGIIIAILVGFTSFSFSTLTLVILGLVVGFLNVSDKESHQYLVAVIALLVIGIAGLQVFSTISSGLNDWVQTVLQSFITFVGASGLVVAIKEVVNSSKA